MGDLKFVVPKTQETFGNLAFAGKGGEETAWGNGGSRRGNKKNVSVCFRIGSVQTVSRSRFRDLLEKSFLPMRNQ